MIPYGRHFIDQDDIDAVTEVLRYGPLTQGPVVEHFEQAIAEYVGSKYAVAVSSATAGLHLAAVVAGVGPKTAIVTTPITFVATANAALYVGGDVRFADIDPITLNIDPDALEQVLSRETNVRAVIPVHFGGLPCAMDKIESVATRAGSVVIEDAAHALGATYPDGRRVGCCANSLMTVFSFHPVKLVAAGEGGVITTNDESVYRRLLRLRSHGINKSGDALIRGDLAKTGDLVNPWYYEMQELGFHYRITDFQCALALAQLKKLDRFLSRRRELAREYDRLFSSFKNLKPAQLSDRASSSLHLYVTRINFSAAGVCRAALMNDLRSRGIGTQVHYIPVTDHPVYSRLGNRTEDFPNCAGFFSEALSIPLFYGLTDQQQLHVVDSLRQLLE
jgi:perosamine synthetase